MSDAEDLAVVDALACDDLVDGVGLGLDGGRQESDHVVHIVQVCVLLDHARHDVARIKGFLCQVMDCDILIVLGQDSHLILEILVVSDLHTSCQDVVALCLGEQTFHPVFCAHICLYQSPYRLS